MDRKSINRGSLLSLGAFVGVLIAGSNFSQIISESPIATNGLLVVAAASMLGCGYFLPRSVRLWVRRKRK
jgi:uncharacterized membrane protein YccC